MLLPLSRLTLDSQLQARAGGLHPDHVARLREALRDGATLPAVVAYDDEIGRLWLADGWHRVAAHRDEGREEIEVVTHPGGRAAALVHALGANAHHGLPRTRDDKRRAVDLALYDAELVTLPDREIARITATSHTFVATRRGLIQAEAQGREAAPRSRDLHLARARGNLVGGLGELLDMGITSLVLPIGERRVEDLIPEVATWQRAAVEEVLGIAGEAARQHGRAQRQPPAAPVQAPAVDAPAETPQPPAAERRADSRARGERIGRCIAALRLRSEPLYLPDLGSTPLTERDVRALADEQLDRLESILVPTGPTLAQLRDQAESALTTLIRLGVDTFDLPDQPGQEIGLWLDGLDESTADELAAALPVLQERIEVARADRRRVVAEEAERPGASVCRVVEATDDEDAMLGEALDQVRQERDAARREAADAHAVCAELRTQLAAEKGRTLHADAEREIADLRQHVHALQVELMERSSVRHALDGALERERRLGLDLVGARAEYQSILEENRRLRATQPVETLPEGWPPGWEPQQKRRLWCSPRDADGHKGPQAAIYEVAGDGGLEVAMELPYASTEEEAIEWARRMAWGLVGRPLPAPDLTPEEIAAVRARFEAATEASVERWERRADPTPDPLALYRPWTRSADELAAHLEALEQGERYDLAQAFGVSLGGRLVERLTMAIMRPGRVAA